jgi:hypothetical protein
VAEHPRSQPARLLVLGAGAAQLGLLEAAAARDLSVIAVDRNALAPGFAFADERAVISSEDEAGIERLAKAREVDGIISPGADWPVGLRRGSLSTWACRIRSAALRPSSRRRRRASGSGSPPQASSSLGPFRWLIPRSRFPASSRRPTGRASAG